MPSKAPIPGWDDALEAALVALYAGTLKGELSDEMITLQAEYLAQALTTGYEEEAGLAYVDEALQTALRENVYYFSGFKNFQQMREASLLLAADPEMRLDIFRTNVLAIDRTYNVTYLATEHQFATRSAASISFMGKAYAEEDALPYLQWRAVHDRRTMPLDASLDGIIRKVRDPFWTEYPQPLHWRCRCDRRQLGPDAEETADSRMQKLERPEPYFRYDQYNDQVIFPLSKKQFDTVHPYAANTTQAEYNRVTKRVDQILGK